MLKKTNGLLTTQLRSKKNYTSFFKIIIYQSIQIKIKYIIIECLQLYYIPIFFFTNVPNNYIVFLLDILSLLFV